MTRARLCQVLLLAAAVPVPAVDPTLLQMVPPEARRIAGANLQAARTSPLGLFLLQRSRMAPEDTGFRRFVGATGFDPREDLHEVLLASNGDPERQKAVLLARGLFDVIRITAYAVAQGIPITRYSGAVVLVVTRAAERNSTVGPGWVAFVSGSIAVAGDADWVRVAIDRHRRGGPPLDARLTARVMDLSRQYQFWGISLVPGAQWLARASDERVSALLRNHPLQGVLESSAGVKLGPEVVVDAELLARSSHDAVALADVVRLIVVLVTLNAKDPKAAEAAKWLPSLRATVEGSLVKISLRIPESELEKILLAAQASPQPSPRRVLGRRPLQ
ncbi:MAG: hypothetical protein RMK57_05690 [Bryobacterales bacterium]|nr:hypothetical protein [Bryobacteraceae bacterium]MDW8354006.1 hypothetical protein [Bryobacterales bacterium]